MGKSDALSRRADHGDGSGDNDNLILLQPSMFAIRALEAYTLVGEESVFLQDIRASKDLDEVAVTAAKELTSRKGQSKSVRSDEWVEEDGLLYYRGKIYVPKDLELRRRIVEQHHDTPVAGHPGRFKTLELVSRNFWWPGMNRYIGDYTRHCDRCIRTKTRRHRPVGHLQPTETPKEPWKRISVDFVVGLPDSHGYDATMNVVCTLSKQAHFIKTTGTIDALGTARLYRDNVWKLHGLPDEVICDRGPQFVAEFTRELHRLLGIKSLLSTSHHPQTDGQTERVNQEMEQFLRVFVNQRQDDWEDWIAMAEFAWSNHVHSSSQHTPFFLNNGRHPRMGFEPVRSKVPAVDNFVTQLQASWEEARSAIIKAKDEMAKYYNRRREPTPVLKVGDKVWLDSSDIRTTRPSRKLSDKWLGPFEIIEKVSSMAYRLQLPLSMKGVHNVFPIVKLELRHEDPITGRHPEPPPPPDIIDGEEEWEIEKIVNSRFYGRWKKFQYQVKWKGYVEPTWCAEALVGLVTFCFQPRPGPARSSPIPRIPYPSSSFLIPHSSCYLFSLLFHPHSSLTLLYS
jgi:hypothetical protein